MKDSQEKRFAKKPHKQEFIEIYDMLYPHSPDDDVRFAHEMYDIVMENTDTRTITAIPAPCGIGKTKFIRAFAIFCMSDKFGNERGKQNQIGLVVITDRKERLSGYNRNADNKYKITEYDIFKDWGIEISTKFDYTNSYSLIKTKEESGEEISKQIVESTYKPVVFLTTQRFFSMDNELHKLLFDYRIDSPTKEKDSKGKIKKVNVGKKIVLFDEKPYFYSMLDIKGENLHSCSNAIREALPTNTREIANSKKWILSEFDELINNLIKYLDNEEYTNENTHKLFYWKPIATAYQDSIVINVEFQKIIDNHQTWIRSKYQNFYSDLVGIRQLLTEGGLCRTRKLAKGEPYETCFSVIIDHKDKFYIGEDKAKYFVFDATADISPQYKVDYVELIDCSEYVPQLNTTTINLYDLVTSKTQLKNPNRKEQIFRTINKIAQANNPDSEKEMYITHQDFYKEFPIWKSRISDESGKTKIEYFPCYFGNVKGSNVYRECQHVNHIGNCRFPDINFLVQYLVQSPKEYARIKNMTELESENYIGDLMRHDTGGSFINLTIDQIMMDSILEDFEQNIFRSAIRVRDNIKPVIINAYWSNKTFQVLNEMIEKRYGEKGYRAVVRFNGVPHEVAVIKIKSRKTSDNKQSDAQIIIDWITGKDVNMQFSKREMLDELNMSNKRFDKAKENNASLRKIMSECLIDKHKGIYQTPEV